jgi:hypothetical protein
MYGSRVLIGVRSVMVTLMMTMVLLSIHCFLTWGGAISFIVEVRTLPLSMWRCEAIVRL